MGLGPTANYLCKYNNYVLPGYVQNEQFRNDMDIADHYAIYADGSPYSEYLGLKNKALVVTLKVWEQDFATCKDQVELAATYVRSKRDGFADLYLQYSDRHYEALTQSINDENVAGKSPRLMEYSVTFNCKPWLINDVTTTISGVGVIDTDQVSRSITDGGWTPVKILLSGTDITVSGYTSTGDFTGYISVSGHVSSLLIDSENYIASFGVWDRGRLEYLMMGDEYLGGNQNNLLKNADYALYVGPGKTYFDITGATDCIIQYNNRWFL